MTQNKQIVFKLTDANMQTYMGFQYQLLIERTANGIGPLCSPGWLHAYTHPLLAEQLNILHADLDSNKRLFRAEAIVGLTDHGLKVGCTSLTLLEEIPVPVITVEQRIRFAILCTWEACNDITWRKWAQKWLDGSDRSTQAIKEISATAIANEILEMGTSKELAAMAATRTLDAAAIPLETNSSLDEVSLDGYVAYEASMAVENAANVKELDLIALAEEAMTEARR